MIFYFSGTGNSLYVARKIAERTGDQVCSMSEDAPDRPIGGKDEKVGFVFPSYYGNLPRVVQGFIRKLNIRPETYTFGVVTMGAVGLGSVTMLEKALAEKKLTLKYGCGIRMPANYIANYNPMFFGRTAKSGAKIRKIADDIQSEKALVKRGRLISARLYQKIEELDRDFFADDRCSGWSGFASRSTRRHCCSGHGVNRTSSPHSLSSRRRTCPSPYDPG